MGRFHLVVDNLSNHQKGRVGQRSQVVGVHPFRGCLDVALLLHQAAFRDHSNGGLGFVELDEVHRDVLQPSAAHEHDKCGRRVEGVEEVAGQTAVLSRGGAEPSRRGHASERERNASQSCKRRPTRDARHVCPAQAELFRKGQFFAGTPKHHGIASFQTNDAQALSGAAFNPVVDEDLGRAGLASSFANAHQLGVWMGHVQHLLMDEAVVEHELGLCQGFGAFEGHQVGVAGTGADEPKVGRRRGNGCTHVRMLLWCWPQCIGPRSPRRTGPFGCRLVRTTRCSCHRGRT